MLLSMLPTGAFALEREETIGQKTANQKAVKTGVDEAPVTLTSPNGDMGQILAENQPDRVQSVTVEKIEKPDDVEALSQSGQSLKPQQSLYDTQELVRAIVILEDKGLLEQGYSTDAISAQTTQVVSSQKSLLKQQEAVTAAMGRVVQEVSPEAELEVRYHYTIAANGMAVELPYGALARILSLDGVKAAFLAPQYEVPRDMTDNDAVLPCTHATPPAIGAVKTWDVGYTGQGMRIAIVDTGLDLDHPSFAAAPQEPSLNKEELSRLIPNLNAAGMFQGLNADRLYRSEKVPYAFNYVDGTLDVTHDNDDQGDHGTHVAGIAAANRLETTDVVGVAPDAQLLIMKVFGANGGAYFDDILACLEDCYVLNVDVVNMSLGTPAGFTSLSPEIDEIFARILQSDMVAAIAAGNSYFAAYMNGTGTNRNQTSDPDNGIMSSPASYIGATAVASVENSAIRFNYVELENGAKIPYNDVAATALTTLYWVDPAHRAEFVMIPGTGSAEDFAGYAPAMDEEGIRLYGVSIAVIQRGGIDFVTKQANAAAVGFDACIVYDNTEGDLLNMVDGGVIPNVYISKASGEAMLEAAGEDRRGVLYLKSVDETETVPSSLAGQMSDFSSWGVTPDLQLNPEVTAPGGNIYSTLTNDLVGNVIAVIQHSADLKLHPIHVLHGIAAITVSKIQAPVLDMSSMVYDYDEDTDTRTLTFTVSDNYDIAAVVPLTKGAAAFDYIPVTTKEAGVDGESAAITLDVSDYDSVFQIAVCDYGTNESYYEISFAGQQNYREDSFFAYRLFSAIPQDSNIYLTEAYNGWQSFLSADQMLMHTSMLDEGETYTYAAEYVDGYIIGIDANSTIYATELGQWVRTDLGKLEAEMMIEFYPGGYEVGDYYMMNVQFPALDMAFDHTTDTLYVLTDESMYLGPNTGGHLLTVDWLTGEATYVGRVSGLTDDHQALTLACDNDGVLYTVDAITGDLYTINRETAVATFVGQTGYTPLYQQSMTVDHETNKLYWAAYQDVTGVSSFFEVDKTTGQLLSATATEYNSQLSGLFKPYDTHRNLVPDGAALTGLTLLERKLTLRGGDTTSLHCQPQPYYAELNAEDLTWTSSDSAVATVENGTVAAVGSGTAIITAAVGELTASCQVEVVTLGGQLYAFNFGTDMSAANAWITMDVNQPQSAKLLADAMAIPNGVTAAAYVDGSVYAFDSAGAFYELDAETFQGRLLKPADNTTAVTAMAFNYADGFLYALSYDGNSSFALCQVNLYTGELRPVMESLEMMYGTPLGGMAIDYEGRFYFMNLDASGALRLDSFKLTYDGWMYMGEGYVSATLPGLNCYSFSSLAWSEQNDGLFWANDQGQIHWIGVEVDTRLVEEEWGEYEETYLDAGAVLLGGISDAVSPATGQAMIMGLLEIPEREPQYPEVPLQSAAMPESITVAAGGHTQTGLSVEPWNAKYTVEYAMADTTVATVSDSGIITGVSKGDTTLTATIYHADGTVFQTLTAEVKAVFSDVDVYCFMITDGANGGDAWLRINGVDPTKLSVAGNTTVPVYAAAYYDGKVYAVSPTDEEYGYRNHLMRIDSSSFVVEEVLPVALPCDLRDMAFDYTTGTMYGIAQSGTVTGGVAQIDLTTGAVTVVADTGSELVTLSCDADGQLYTITADGVLCRLDKYTGALEEIQKVSGSLSGYQSMHYDHVTGNTYWGRDALYLVDTKNGNTTMLGRIGGTYMLVGSVFIMPSEELEPDVPETTGVTGICLTERAAVVRGETAQLTASVLPVSVSQVDKTVTWTSSDTAVATVDVNGVVTGISGGTVTITATAGDYTDTCVVTVLEEAQKFYAYEENSHRWVQIDTGTGDLITVREEPTLAPIVATADTGETIYAYDEDGYFYSIDPVSFARTKLSDGVHGMTQDAFDGWTYYTTEVNITDMSYDAESGRLFGILNGLYEDGEGLYLIYSALVEINLQAGRLNPYSYEEMEVGQIIFISTYGDGNMVYRPGNLLVKGGYAYSVDTWYSGILSRVSLTWDPWMEFYYAGDREQLAHVNQLEWGMFFDSRSLVYDPVFDVTYTFHDLGQDELGSTRSDVTLCTINLGNAATSEVCNLGKDVVLNSLIIR